MSLGLAKRYIRQAIHELAEEPQSDNAMDSLDEAYEELTKLEAQFSKALRQRISERIGERRQLWRERPFTSAWRIGFDDE